ncbi:MAG TPA: acetyl-CoA carboxylase, carboxyltransferase subunit beta [Thermoanaerobaculia bacterium]|jgi:acetyl-CoA carboxylase carboxyl transferase subunit beta|nr:acetyl-CoA carboxylase, carboxyltransferase subunit beta [Thermoanaerobaculia bacterium]
MWFKKDKAPKEPRERRPSKVPEGLWVKCDNCREILYNKELARNFKICPKCQFHFRLSAPERLQMLFDDEQYVELDGELRSADPLKFRDTKRYRDRLRQYEESAGASEAIRTATGAIGGIPVIVGAMEFSFLGGSMGSVVGEKVARAAERALHERKPLVLVSTSGGARMQEGILSLMQMGKIAAALARLSEGRVPYISIMTDPTTGGVTASYAMLGDLNLAEPQALIGFAGPRVIEQTIRQTLPEGFQRSEFLLEHGMLDMVVPRSEMKATIVRCLKLLWDGGSGR